MFQERMTEEYIYSHLLNAILSGKLQNVVDFAYEVFGEPVKVIDPGYRFLAVAPTNSIGDRHWDVHSSSMYTPIDLVTECYNNQYRAKTLSGDGVTYIDWGVDHPRLVGNITVKKSVVAFMAVCFIDGEIPDKEGMEWMRQTLRIFCKAGAAILMNDTSVGMVYKTEYDSMISMLFNGRQFSEDELHYWENISNVRLKDKFAVVAIAVKKHSPFSLDYFKAMLRPISTIIAYNFSDNYLYLLIPGISDHSVYHTYCENMSVVLRELDSHAGASQLFDNINDVSRQLHYALLAHDIGLKTGHNEEVFLYDDIQSEIILYSGLANLSQGECMHSCLHQLRDYDARNNTQYYATLNVYLTSMCNSPVASERLFIHRNTLQYRLNKITEMCNIDLDDVDLCSKLMLSYLAVELNGRIGQ